MDTKLIYKTRQSLHGSSTDYCGEIPVRAVVKRDAYDEQSHGVAQVWTAEGWTDVQRFPVSVLAVAGCSYVSRDGEWEDAMVHDLDGLVAYAYEHLANVKEGN